MFSTLCKFFVLAVLLSSPGSNAISQEEKAQPKITKTLKVRVSMDKAGSGQYVSYAASTQVEPLECGKRYKLLLTIENKTKDEVVFDRIASSCLCGSFKIEKNLIPANGIATGEVLWSVPSSNQTRHGTLVATLYRKDVAVGEVRLKTYLRGNFYLGLVSGGRRIDGGLFEWRVPIAVSTPLSLDKLEVALSDQLDGFSVELVTEPNKSKIENKSAKKEENEEPELEQGWIRIQAHESIIGNEYRFGELVVQDPNRLIRNRHNLALYAQPPIRISPTRIGFRELENEDQESDSLKGTALIQLDKTFFNPKSVPAAKNREKRKPKAEKTFSASLELGNKSVPTKVTHLGRNVYRVEIEGNKNLFKDKKDLTGSWTIIVDNKKFEIPTTSTFQ